jgi:hypothetical protein
MNEAVELHILQTYPEDTMDTKQKHGILTTYLFQKRFGFIEVYTNGVREKYFLHATKIEDGAPAIGSVVHFDVNPVREGVLPSAVNAVIVSNGGAK